MEFLKCLGVGVAVLGGLTVLVVSLALGLTWFAGVSPDWAKIVSAVMFVLLATAAFGCLVRNF